MKLRNQFVVPLTMVGAAGCSNGGGEDRPPPITSEPPEETVAFATQCSCTVGLSGSASWALLQELAPVSVDLNVDACLLDPTAAPPTVASVNETCDVAAGYVQSSLEDIAKAKVGAGEALICASDTAWITSLSCTPTSVSPRPEDQDVFADGTAKATPMCASAYQGAGTQCSFDSDASGSAGYCQVNSVDVQEPFNAGTCACDTVVGCEGEPVRLERQPVGNADDPPVVPPFGPHGPVNSFVVGRKDGVVDDGQIYVSHAVRGCLGPICATDRESDSSNLWGDIRLYGGPCEGASCEVALEMNLAGSSMDFDFGIDTPLGDVTFESHTISELTIYLGSGEYSLTVDAAGNAVVPADQFQYKIYWKDNGKSKQAIGWFDEEVEFHIDWATRTVSVESLSLDLGLGTTRLTDLSASFGTSLMEKLNYLCPAPQFQSVDETLALACTADSSVSFEPPPLAIDCAETPTTISGEIIEVNGAPLAEPLPIVHGKADVASGRVRVRWTATDTRGRVDHAEQLVETLVRPALASSHSLYMGDHFSVLEPSGVNAAVLNFGSGETVLNVEGRVGEISSVSQVEFRDRATAEILLSPSVYLSHYNQVSVGEQRYQTPSPIPFPEHSSLPAGTEAVFVGPNETMPLAPGQYGVVRVHPQGRLVLSSGKYVFAELDLHAMSHLDIQNSAGEVEVVVLGSTRLQSMFNYSSGLVSGFTLAYLGTGTVYLESQFKGTLLVPNGTINVRALDKLRHEGEFFARDIKTEGGAKILHVPSSCE